MMVVVVMLFGRWVGSGWTGLGWLMVVLFVALPVRLNFRFLLGLIFPGSKIPSTFSVSKVRVSGISSCVYLKKYE